jgi:hypothetical protein
MSMPEVVLQLKESLKLEVIGDSKCYSGHSNSNGTVRTGSYYTGLTNNTPKTFLFNLRKKKVRRKALSLMSLDMYALIPLMETETDGFRLLKVSLLTEEKVVNALIFRSHMGIGSWNDTFPLHKGLHKSLFDKLRNSFWRSGNFGRVIE